MRYLLQMDLNYLKRSLMQEVVRRGLDVQLQDDEVPVGLQVRYIHPVQRSLLSKTVEVRPELGHQEIELEIEF